MNDWRDDPLIHGNYKNKFYSGSIWLLMGEKKSRIGGGVVGIDDDARRIRLYVLRKAFYIYNPLFWAWDLDHEKSSYKYGGVWILRDFFSSKWTFKWTFFIAYK